MISSITYYVGKRGTVKKLLNLTQPWLDISLELSLPGGSRITLLDVETSTTNGNTVFTVGTAMASLGFYGIYISFDGGDNWIIPTGNYNSVWSDKFYWYEVSVVSNDVIYISGSQGYICKSIDGGQTFNMCTRIQPVCFSYGDSPEYSEAFSLHFISNNVGVVGLYNNTALTIDGGVTWTISGNGYGIHYSDGAITPNPGKILGVHLSANNQTINAVGEAYIVKSNNAGVSYSKKYLWIERTGLHLTWLNDSTLLATGSKSNRVSSNDAGETWNILSNFNHAGIANYAAHLYQDSKGFVSGENDVYDTSDNSITLNLTDTNQVTIYAVWTHLDKKTYYLRDCEGILDDIYVNNDLSANVGEVIKICDLTQYLITISETPIYENSFILHDCCGELDDLYVNADLAPYNHLILYLPNVYDRCWEISRVNFNISYPYIDINGLVVFKECVKCMEEHPCKPYVSFVGCKCFSVQESDEYVSGITITIDSNYDTCNDCNSNCYELTNCLDATDTLITSCDLSEYLNQTITLDSCPDKCWEVTLADNCEDAIIIGQVTSSFPDCISCLPKAPQTVITINHRMVQPGYNTPTCDPANYEKTMCRFATIVHKEMAVQRYGVSTCCEEDKLKWEIKKWLIDLGSIYDPSLCQTVICCPPCDVTASISTTRFI